MNTVAERGDEDATIAAAGGAYVDRLRAAFARPLGVAVETGEIAGGSIEPWATTFALLTIGSFVAVRGQDPARIRTIIDHAIAQTNALRATPSR